VARGEVVEGENSLGHPSKKNYCSTKTWEIISCKIQIYSLCFNAECSLFVTLHPRGILRTVNETRAISNWRCLC
jgi:hypothetical protein